MYCFLQSRLPAAGDFDAYAVVKLWPRLEELYGPVPNDSRHLSCRERSRIYAAVL